MQKLKQTSVWLPRPQLQRMIHQSCTRLVPVTPFIFIPKTTMKQAVKVDLHTMDTKQRHPPRSVARIIGKAWPFSICELICSRKSTRTSLNSEIHSDSNDAVQDMFSRVKRQNRRAPEYFQAGTEHTERYDYMPELRVQPSRYSLVCTHDI